MDHSFPKEKITPKEAIQIQKELRDKIKIEPLKHPVKLVGGADVSMNLFSTHGFAGFVTLDYKTLHMIDHSVVRDKIGFPYIPGLLSFREIPMLLKAWDTLVQKPDVIVVDGVGIAHPRRLGIATHLGLILGIPTIGCAKSVLTGVYTEPDNVPGSISYLRDKLTGEVIGAAYRSKLNVKPIFISPGHMITLEESLEIIEACVIIHRLPEPTRLAHNTVNKYRIESMR
ncbi:MAG: endonuclease [Candidatus Kaiserbacteria bacterium]|nr:endonuclease [Candidatus Kaiserbacteria bacterium]